MNSERKSEKDELSEEVIRLALNPIKKNDLAESQQNYDDGFVKSSRCKARKN
jgi:hypothetical protein